MSPNPSRVLAGCLMSLLLVGCMSAPPAAPEPIAIGEGFEEGLAAWSKGTDLPDDPNQPGGKVDWEIGVNESRSRTGLASVEFFIDGSQDDGTIWIARQIEASPGVTYQANISAWYWSASESFNTLAHAVVAIGSQAPQVEDDFPPPGEAGGEHQGVRESLNAAEGWYQYAFMTTVTASKGGQLHVAFGISAVWETEMTYWADDIEIELAPR